jgi:hypothetical protein
MKANDVKGKDSSPRSLTIVHLIPVLVFFISTATAAIAFLIPVKLSSPEYVNAHLYVFGTAGQFLMDLLPVVLLVHSKWNWHGSRRDEVVGAGVGLAGAVLLATIRFAIKGELVFMEQVPAFGQGQALPLPWSVLAPVMAVLAYGPGEALFQVYLILAFDEAVGHQQRLMSLGVVLNALLWGLGHIAGVITYGWSAIGNAILMLVIGIVVGLLFKKTRSALAPVVFWTLINGTSV